MQHVLSVPSQPGNTPSRKTVFKQSFNCLRRLCCIAHCRNDQLSEIHERASNCCASSKVLLKTLSNVLVKCHCNPQIQLSVIVGASEMGSAAHDSAANRLNASFKELVLS